VAGEGGEAGEGRVRKRSVREGRVREGRVRAGRRGEGEEGKGQAGRQGRGSLRLNRVERHAGTAYDIDGCGISSPPIRAFKNFRAVIKIRTDAVCCIHVNTILSNQSMNQYQSFAVTRCQIFRLKCTKFNFQTPLEELTVLPRPIAGGEGLAVSSPRTPPPLSALRASLP